MINQQKQVLRQLWRKQYTPSGKSFLMFLNFLFGILPGVVYILRNVFIDDEKVMRRASFGSSGYWIYFLLFAIGFTQSFVELVYFKRVMSITLLRSYFLGQLLSVFMLFLATEKRFIKFIQTLVKQNKNDTSFLNNSKKTSVLLFLIAFCTIFFWVFINSNFSELTYGN
tara:strand:- start:6617 stop:7123 length:507 start_codon:yes stop_codon:yes gene_type:complete